MKALNYNEIIKRYLIFLGYFSLLILCTILCLFFYFRTYNTYVSTLMVKKDETAYIANKRAHFATKIDSLNTFLHLLHTGQVRNDAALERTILKLKYATLKEIEKTEAGGSKHFNLYRKLLMNVEPMLDAKKVLLQTKEEEEINKKKLMECNRANQKLRNQ